MANDRNSGRSGSGGSKKRQEKLSIKVMLGPCKISFPHLFEPTETDNGDRYQANFLFPPKSDFRKLEDAMDEVMIDFFGPKDDWPRGRAVRLPKDVIRDATEKDYEGYKDGWDFIKASSKDPVGIIDVNKDEVTNPRDVYGGRWCRISVTVAAYDNVSKGVGIYLNSVQVLDHDTPFGGRGPAKNDFDDWDGDALSDDDRGNGATRGRDDRDDDRDRRGSRDNDRRGSDRSRDRDDDRGQDDRGSSRRSRDDDKDDRGTRGRDRDDDRRSSRDRDDGRSQGRDDDERGARGRGRDDDRGSSRSSDRDDDRSRGRDRDDRDDRGGRSRDRNDGDDRGRGRSARDDRDAADDRRSSRDDRGSTRDRDTRDDDDRRPSRGRDNDDDRGSRGRGDRDWN